MTDQELLNAMSKMMDEKLEPINERLDRMDEKLESLEEGQAELRTSVNRLLDWSEKVSDSLTFPLPKVIP